MIKEIRFLRRPTASGCMTVFAAFSGARQNSCIKSAYPHPMQRRETLNRRRWDDRTQGYVKSWAHAQVRPTYVMHPKRTNRSGSHRTVVLAGWVQILGPEKESVTEFNGTRRDLRWCTSIRCTSRALSGLLLSPTTGNRTLRFRRGESCSRFRERQRIRKEK